MKHIQLFYSLQGLFFLMNWLRVSVEDQLSIYVWVYFYFLQSVSLICSLTTVLHHLDYLRIFKPDNESPVSLKKKNNCFGYSIPFEFAFPF